MSTIPSFLVGLVASGVGYAYLSRELVTSRNQLMLKHFKADGVEPYHPVRKFGRPKGERGGCPSGSSLNSETRRGVVSGLPEPAPAGEHHLVTDARTKWNAAVLRCSDAVFSALYGRGGATEGNAKGGDEPRDS
ncbi:unnamed protein product [Ectocarpus sp. CCAP 1310/34]|nr:unnamed protein product [Ectocarpus sp. CCAP 1310/34]